MSRLTLESILEFYPDITGIHPACKALPELDDDDFNALAQSVADRGLLHAVKITPDGQLIDGRHRVIACHMAQIDILFERAVTDPWHLAFDENMARRQMKHEQKTMYGVAFESHFAEQAKKRQGARNDLGNIQVNCSESNGQARDQAGAMVGVSGTSIDRGKFVVNNAPDLAEKLRAGAMTLNAAVKETKQRIKQNEIHAAPKEEAEPSKEMTTVITPAGKTTEIPKPNKVVFNRTNDSVDWASWTWNPVTGCEHGCSFCYAREIAHSQRMAPFYPNKFEPTFHEYRLDAPKNTKVPDSDKPQDGRVFVCSMADLFGKWVPQKWIKAVFDACLASPEWEYLFLTKWPARYSQMPLIDAAWYGASVIKQADVSRVEKAMAKFDCPESIKWISLEPMLGPIEFNDLSWCDLVVIGSQTSTNQPDGHVAEFAPEFDWVVDVVNQCRDAGVPYYLKANLGRERPGMVLPKGSPSE